VRTEVLGVLPASTPLCPLRRSARRGRLIAAYLGNGAPFDKSVTDFAERYADQNERDYQEVHRRDQVGAPDSRRGV
jgi:Uncharacterized protein conserved in bacteria (DUF2252)